MSFNIMKISEIIKNVADPDFIKICEQDYEAKLDSVAKDIFKNSASRPFLLISGPSGSGKTTAGLKLEERLDKLGCETHIISMDNYFHPIKEEERLLFEAHKLDLEAPSHLDSDLLNSQLKRIMRGDEVEIPSYNFLTNKREKSGKYIKLHKGELIILEGIHSLNPEVIENSEQFGQGFYISVRSRVEHNGSLLHPSKIRLARRMIRDVRTRNRAPDDVLSQYNSVERGENLYIMPHKHRADYEIDSFIPYELCVYKSMLPELLSATEKESELLTELINIMSELPNIKQECVPYNSLLREFIGGGKY